MLNFQTYAKVNGYDELIGGKLPLDKSQEEVVEDTDV